MYIKAHDLFPSNIHVIIWDSLDVLKAADLQIPNTASYEHYSIYFELDQFITLLLLVQRGELTKIQLFVPPIWIYTLIYSPLDAQMSPL